MQTEPCRDRWLSLYLPHIKELSASASRLCFGHYFFVVLIAHAISGRRQNDSQRRGHGPFEEEEEEEHSREKVRYVPAQGTLLAIVVVIAIAELAIAVQDRGLARRTFNAGEALSAAQRAVNTAQGANSTANQVSASKVEQVRSAFDVL